MEAGEVDGGHDLGHISSTNWETQWRTAIIEGKKIPHDIIGALPLAAGRLGCSLGRVSKTLHYTKSILYVGRRFAV